VVFICHASEDREVALSLTAGLERRGVDCWIAPRDVEPGAQYASAIVEAISESKALVLIFSEHSNESPHVIREVERAVTRKLQLIPVRIGDVEPSTGLEYFISTAQWVDATSGTLDAQLDRLATVLESVVSDDDAMSDNARDALRQLVVRYGNGLVDDPRRVQALLRDVAGAQRLEVAALVAAAEEGAGHALLLASDPAAGTVDRMVRRLVDERGLREDVASWAVDSWAFALDLPGFAAFPPQPPTQPELDRTVPAPAHEPALPSWEVEPDPPARAAEAGVSATDGPVLMLNRLAVWSLVSGILWVFWLGSIVAVVLGHLALKQIEASRGGQRGRGLAIAGLVVGYVGIALFFLGLIGVAMEGDT